MKKIKTVMAGETRHKTHPVSPPPRTHDETVGLRIPQGRSAS